MKEEIVKLRNESLSWTEIGRKLGIHPERARSIYRTHARRNDIFDPNEDDFPTLENYSEILFPDKKIQENVDWRKIIDVAGQSQEINRALDDSQRIATVEIDTKRPISIMFSGDWHLGDGSTNHGDWKRDMEYVLSTNDLYIVDTGDDIQNMRTFKTLSGVLGQVLSPKQQAYLMKGVIDELTEKNKLICKVRGNHDLEFDERIFGQSIQMYLLNKVRAPLFNNRGLIKLRVGKAWYTILVFHKSRFRSFMRTTHGNYREYQLSAPADIIAGAHDHVPALEIVYHYNLANEAGMGVGGQSIFVKNGTYQDSEFGWRYFHGGPLGVSPTIVLSPDERYMIPFMNARDAVKFANSM